MIRVFEPTDYGWHMHTFSSVQAAIAWALPLRGRFEKRPNYFIYRRAG